MTQMRGGAVSYPPAPHLVCDWQASLTRVVVNMQDMSWSTGCDVLPDIFVSLTRTQSMASLTLSYYSGHWHKVTTFLQPLMGGRMLLSRLWQLNN